MRRIWATGLTALAGVGLLTGVACSSTEGPPATAVARSQDQSASVPRATIGSSSSTASQTGELSAADVVTLAEPAIVRIETTAGVGSGFIISSDGYIITNNHVVTGLRGQRLATVNVGLSDGSTLNGKVVGGDDRSDLAVVKIDGGPYKSLELADLDNVVVGQDVLAIGYALDLKMGEGASFSVTRGIISAKNRAIDETSQVLGAIQTDAAINHGNSGGPLIDLFGQVVGVNTALAPDTTAGQAASGIGFAVGSNLITAVYEQIKENGRVNRGFLGIRDFEALRPAQARDLGLAGDARGVYLPAADAVQPGGPAAEAGITSGDVIASIDGNAIRNESDLAVQMITHAPGSKVTVAVFRGGKTVSVSVTLGTPPTL